MSTAGEHDRDERFARTDGVRVEAIGNAWMAFSPTTGLTVLLNDESAAILESLDDEPGSARDLAMRLLGAEAGSGSIGQALQALAQSWITLVDAGLVHRVDAG